MKTIRVLIICTLVVMLHGWLTGCRPARPTPAPVAAADAAATAQAGALPRLDSVVVQPPRSLLDKVLSRPAQADIVVGQSPARIGKKSTVNYYYAAATITNAAKKATIAAEGAVVAGKVKAPVSTGPGDATDQRKATNAAAIKGNDNQLSQKADKPPTETLWQRARPYVFGALGLGGLWLLLPFLIPAAATVPGWLLPLLWRKRKQAQA